MTLLYVRFPAPVVTGEACGRCAGAGVLEGQRVTLDLGAGMRALLLDVFCPRCGGCGNADPQHGACADVPHSWWDDHENADVDGDRGGSSLCGLCGGRGWTAVIGFGPDDGDPDSDADGGGSLQMVQVRMPCSCQEHRAEELEAGVR